MFSEEEEFRSVVTKIGHYLTPRELWETIQTFVSDAEATLDELSQMGDNADADTMTRHLHTLKGNSQTLGAAALAQLCKHAEYQLKMIGYVPEKPLLLQQMGDALQVYKSLITVVLPAQDSLPPSVAE